MKFKKSDTFIVFSSKQLYSRFRTLMNTNPRDHVFQPLIKQTSALKVQSILFILIKTHQLSQQFPLQKDFHQLAFVELCGNYLVLFVL
jgi:hypothetical protein